MPKHVSQVQTHLLLSKKGVGVVKDVLLQGTPTAGRYSTPFGFSCPEWLGSELRPAAIPAVHCRDMEAVGGQKVSAWTLKLTQTTHKKKDTGDQSTFF